MRSLRHRVAIVGTAISLSTSLATAQTFAKDSARVAPLVIGETFTIASATLQEVRRINVYAPAGYPASPDMRLPVLYMPDGGIGEDFLHVAGLVQVLTGNGGMRPFLLVGIENTERRRDMTGPTQDSADKRIAPRVGGSAAFRAFIRTELMPQIRARYRTTDETAVVGESLAGLFVVETLLLEPDLFDSYIAFDPSLWWNRESLLSRASELMRAHTAKGKSVFVARSSEPSLAAPFARFVTAVRANRNLTVRSAVLMNETHATIYHPAAIQAFRILFKPVAAK